MLENERCSNCGTDPTEWLDPEGREVNPPPYIVSDRRCFGCKTKANHHEALKNNDLTGVSFGLVRNVEKIEPDEVLIDV